MSEPRGYAPDLFDAHIDGIEERVAPLPKRIERYVLVDALLDYRLDHPVLEAQMVVDWLIVNLITSNNRTLIHRHDVDSLLSELRIA